MSLAHRGIDLGQLLLTLTLALCVFFSYWLVRESEDEKYHRIYSQHDKLLLKGFDAEAGELLHQTILSLGDGPLAPVHIPLIRFEANGYKKLELWERVLAGDPERELTYIEISNVLDFAPTEVIVGIREKYLAALAAVPGVREDLLIKHGLSLSAHTVN